MINNTKPIVFNTEMVKAILDRRKTQTRRPIKIKNKLTRDWAITTGVEWLKVNFKDEKYPYSIRERNGAWNEYSLQDFIKKYSQYQVGDILYVRETFYPLYNDEDSCVYKADYPLHWTAVDAVYGDIETDTETEKRTVWKPSIHMPKKYARIFLKVTNVRVERLQNMKIEDFLEEGIRDNGFIVKEPENGLNECYKYLKEKWINLWNSKAKDGYKWEDDPFVFVYEFERIKL